MTHKALIKQLEDTCLGLDAVDPLRLLVDDVIAALAQRTEQNFCPRCGKRTNDIHTCTPPQGIYYSPPQRTWVGLTNDELTDLFYNKNLGQQSAVAQAIALLKQKNGFAEEKNT